MCGIFGCFLKRPLTETDVGFCRSGRDALRHRGPDGTGEWFDVEAGVYFGHVRLSILDLSLAASQPMRRGSLTLAYNGEIYNYKDLREELTRKGYRFESTGDTEVLLRGWEFWGQGVLDKIDGMFAFSVWDGRQGHISVDPFGEKPLFWGRSARGIYISSELGPLSKVMGEEADLSGAKLAAYLSLGYIPAPATAYKNIFRLPAACVMSIEHGEVVHRRKYWEMPVGAEGRGRVCPPSKGEENRVLDALLVSLRGRLESDVPLCLFLSSGVDSPLIAALAIRELNTSLKCLTVSFPRGNVKNEAPQAAKIAQVLGLEFEEVESDENPSNAGPEAVLRFFGQPCGNITVVSCFQVSQAASKKYKVAITGMGGDEVFFGYEKHSFFYRYRRLYALPEGLRVFLSGMAKLPLLSRLRIRHFGSLMGVHEHEFYVANKNYPCIQWLKNVPEFDSWALTEFGGNALPIELLVPAYEISHAMQNSHLIALDLGSMRSSLELRTPFLNRKIVEVVSQLDPRLFLAFGQKYILRRLLSRYIPEKMTEDKKLGFVFPQDQFIRHYGESEISVPGLPKESIRFVWERRFDSKGWSQMAVRLIILSEFIRCRSVGSTRDRNGGGI